MSYISIINNFTKIFFKNKTEDCEIELIYKPTIIMIIINTPNVYLLTQQIYYFELIQLLDDMHSSSNITIFYNNKYKNNIMTTKLSASSVISQLILQ